MRHYRCACGYEGLTDDRRPYVACAYCGASCAVEEVPP